MTKTSKQWHTASRDLIYFFTFFIVSILLLKNLIKEESNLVIILYSLLFTGFLYTGRTYTVYSYRVRFADLIAENDESFKTLTCMLIFALKICIVLLAILIVLIVSIFEAINWRVFMLVIVTPFLLGGLFSVFCW